MTTEKYNGWKNHETWLVNLWMTNDSDTASYWSDRATECRNTAYAHENVEVEKIWTEEEAAKFMLADELKDWTENVTSLSDKINKQLSEIERGLIADLVGSALAEVDWQEIAENMLAAVAEAEAKS